SVPLQLGQGSDGLLSLTEGFVYSLSAKTGILDGHIPGNSAANDGSPVNDPQTQLDSVILTKPDGTAIKCPIHSALNSTQTTDRWTFSCSVGALAAGAPYEYALKVVLSIGKRVSIITSGELYGATAGIPVYYSITLPGLLTTPLNANNAFRNLLSNHQI